MPFACATPLAVPTLPQAPRRGHDWPLTASNSGNTMLGANTYYVPLGGLIELFAAEADAQWPVRDFFILSNIGLNIKTNPSGSAVILRSRINGVNGTCNLTTGVGATGRLTDTARADYLSPSDLVCLSLQVQDATTVSFDVVYATLTNLITGRSIDFVWPLFETDNGVGGGSPAVGAGTFFGPIGAGGWAGSAAEAPWLWTLQQAIEVSNQVWGPTANSLSGTYVMTLRKNSADVTSVSSVPAGSNLNVEDLYHRDSFKVNDTIAIKLVSSGTGTAKGKFGSWRIISQGMFKIVYVTRDGSTGGIQAAGTYYSPIEGQCVSASAGTETSAQRAAGAAGTFKNMFWNVSANTWNAGTVLTLRKNGAPTSLTCTIGASSGATTVSDTTHSVTVVPTDLVDYTIVPAAGAGTLGPLLGGCEFYPT